ncbi:MAG: hypothetical protein JXB35_10430 [Anaerolineae bacterium]|nr:hypothetical protein [Anaerolineae bacterium]
MKGFKVLLVLMVIAVLIGGMLLAQRPEPTEASTVVGYTSTTLAGGTTAYTTTAYSTAYLSGAYGLAQVHGLSATSLTTTTVTYTPQFSNQPTTSCSSISNWFDASTAITATSTANTGAEYSVVGRCFRVKMTVSSGTYTPTVYVRFLNRD